LWKQIETGGRIVNIASIAGNNWRKRRAALVDLLVTSDFAGGLAWWKAHEASIGADAYTVSKEAVVVYTMQLAARGLERRIRANDIGPGPIDTPIYPDFERMVGKQMMDSYVARVGRVGRPDDIAEAVVMLAEGQLGWLNGQHIIVDGGLTATFSAGLKT
jgi:NAD(P)-dependent dehydrogenase (short-subunit alcohol dehydrogenase family)